MHELGATYRPIRVCLFAVVDSQPTTPERQAPGKPRRDQAEDSRRNYHKDKGEREEEIDIASLPFAHRYGSGFSGPRVGFESSCRKDPAFH